MGMGQMVLGPSSSPGPPKGPLHQGGARQVPQVSYIAFLHICSVQWVHAICNPSQTMNSRYHQGYKWVLYTILLRMWCVVSKVTTAQGLGGIAGATTKPEFDGVALL